MEIKLGEFKTIGKHEGCKYDGTLMKCTPQTIDGRKYPATAPDEWIWCNGRDKTRKPRRDLDLDEVGSGAQQLIKRCGYSTYSQEAQKMKDQ